MPMNADIIPQEVALVLLIEFLFGFGYNALVAWAHEHKLAHVSISVAVGVAGTLFIPAVVWFDVEMHFWHAGLLLLACFTASGVPMISGSMRRTVAKKDSKKRHAWPTAAMQVREHVVMELSAMAHEIAADVKNDRLTIRDLPSYVDRLHSVIGALKSV
jgi:hypothetical protein